MNWLAHLRLSPPTPALLRLGNLCGDFVQGADTTRLSADLQRGVQIHRAIDRFTDAHPATVAARSRLPARFRRFAGVLFDVYCDHFLARDWARLGDGTSLPEFLTGVQQDLQRHAALLPQALQCIAPQFSPGGWLAGYGSLAGIDRVFGLMASRLRRPSVLADGGVPLRAAYEPLHADFLALWRDLEPYAVELAAA